MSAPETILQAQIGRIDRANFVGEGSDNLTRHNRHVDFALQCNGYYMYPSKWWLGIDWGFNGTVPTSLSYEFKGQNVSCFGPQPQSPFYKPQEVRVDRLASAFNSERVVAVMDKFRSIDTEQAARIAFILGGLVRHLSSNYTQIRMNEEGINRAVAFTAEMTQLGHHKSADAIASAIAMYVISGGSTKEDRDFKGAVFKMAEAIEEDPIRPNSTELLGLSQVARLKYFLNAVYHQPNTPLPSIEEPLKVFAGFPTVGAEFHLPMSMVGNNPDLLKKIALLNMSQYQRGSYIQLSRNDRDVFEVRMNPSVYPVTTANWVYMRLLVSELDRTYFTTTLNRPVTEGDFYWKNDHDKALLTTLRTLAMLTYAGRYTDRPVRGARAEIDFGTVYVGQTVRMVNGEYQFTGNWGGGPEGEYGQLGVYAGWRDNFPDLAYFLSMGLAEPDVLRSIKRSPVLSSVRSLKDALNVAPGDIAKVFEDIQRNIAVHRRLGPIDQAGDEIITLLNR